MNKNYLIKLIQHTERTCKGKNNKYVKEVMVSKLIFIILFLLIGLIVLGTIFFRIFIERLSVFG